MAQLSLKDTSIPVITPLSGGSKTLTSVFLKNNATSTGEQLKCKPDFCVVIQPGSRTLKMGKAKSASPCIVPHCIGYQENTTSTSTSTVGSKMFSKEEDEKLIDVKEFDECMETLERSKKLPNNFYSTLRTFNQQQSKNFQKLAMSKEAALEYSKFSPESYLVGDEALNADPRECSLVWPMRNGMFADENSIGHMEKIWRVVLTERLKIEDFHKWSCVVIIDDHVPIHHLKAYCQLCLGDLKFNAVGFMRCSQAVSFGAGLSSGLIIDCGAQKLSVSCIEDGVLVQNSISLLGGDTFLQLFHDLLRVNKFPLKSLDIYSNPSHFKMLEEEIWLKQANLDDENEVIPSIAANTPFEFYVKEPGQKDILVYAVKLLDERRLPLLQLFEPDLGLLKRYMLADYDNSFIPCNLQTEPLLTNCMLNPTGISNWNIVSMITEALRLYAMDSPEKLAKFTSNLVITGGGLPEATLPHFIDILNQHLAPNINLEPVQHGMDGRHVAWKGGAVFGRLEGAYIDCMIEAKQWSLKGERLFAEKLSFPIIAQAAVNQTN